MKKSSLSLLVGLLTVKTASAAVIISGSAPTADVLSSLNTGNIQTALFDEDANANHARGQLFSLGDGGGSAFAITAITVRKNQTQTFLNDTLTMRIFEGTQAQWDTGTGHSTAVDGSDYFVDTTVTPLFSESFSLNGAITTGNYVTFELATPLIVNESSDFGFLMTFDQSSGASPDAFRHAEGSSGGRISITTSNHSTSSRNITYYVQGFAIPEPGSTLLLGVTAVCFLFRRRK